MRASRRWRPGCCLRFAGDGLVHAAGGSAWTSLSKSSGISSWFDSLSVLFVRVEATSACAVSTQALFLSLAESWFVMLARLMIESGVQGLPLLLLTRSPAFSFFFFLMWAVSLRQSFSEWFVQYHDPFFLQRWQVPSSPLAV